MSGSKVDENQGVEIIDDAFDGNVTHIDIIQVIGKEGKVIIQNGKEELDVIEVTEQVVTKIIAEIKNRIKKENKPDQSDKYQTGVYNCTNSHGDCSVKVIIMQTFTGYAVALRIVYTI